MSDALLPDGRHDAYRAASTEQDWERDIRRLNEAAREIVGLLPDGSAVDVVVSHRRMDVGLVLHGGICPIFPWGGQWVGPSEDGQPILYPTPVDAARSALALAFISEESGRG